MTDWCFPLLLVPFPCYLWNPVDLNARKAESKEERQKSELRIQEINHRLSISMGEVKTAAESMKLQLITKWASGASLLHGWGFLIVSGIALSTTAILIVGLRFL